MTQVEQSRWTVTVQGNLDALQAERNAAWPKERLFAHESLCLGLEESADHSLFVREGDVVDPFLLGNPFLLDNVDGGSLLLFDLLETGPVVLIFFRFAGCPACNVVLPAYRDALAPGLVELGAHLVAVSPQAPDKLREIKIRHDLNFDVASDPEASLIRAFGIAFSPDDDAIAKQREQGSDLGEVLGTGRWELPYPTAVVIDQRGVVRFADVHPNWMVRTEAATILEAVRTLGGPHSS
jgi:peroxiredoxin